MLTDHKINECNEAIEIEPMSPSDAFDCPQYHVQIKGATEFVLSFQNGPIKEFGVNGITNEALLAIVADRLRRFQTGPYTCRENALALTKLEEAQHWLQHRTRARVQRGVEGTHTP